MNMSQLELMAAQVALNLAGVTGSKEITGTSEVKPDTGYYFCAFHAVADTEVAAQTDKTDAKNADLTKFTKIYTGATVCGKWTAITLTSGGLIGYYAKG
jgi:hypothetical protein